MMSSQLQDRHTWWGDQYALLIRILLMLVSVAPVVVVPWAEYPFILGKVVYVQVLISIAFVLWVPLILLFPENKPKFSWVLLALAGWFVAALVSAILGLDLSKSLWSTYNKMDGLVHWGHWIVYATMLASMFRTVEHWKKFMIVWVTAASVVATVALVIHFEPELSSFLADRAVHTNSPIQASVQLGAYLFFTIGFAVALISQTKSPEEVLLLLTIIAVFLTVIWLVAARAAFLSTVIMVVFYVSGLALMSGRRAVRIACLSGLGMILVGAAMLVLAVYMPPVDYVGSNHSMMRRLGNVLKGEDDSIDRRLDAMAAATHAYQDRTLLGYGPKNFHLAWGKYAPYNEDWMLRSNMLHGLFDDAHSVYFEIMATTGFLGLLMYSIMCSVLMRVAFVSLRSKSPDRTFHLAIITTLIGYFVLCVGMVNSSTFLMCSITMIGYFAYLECQSRKSQPTGTLKPSIDMRWSVVFGSIFTIPIALSLIIVFNASLFASGQDVNTVMTGQDAEERYIPETYGRIRAFPPMTDAQGIVILREAFRMSKYGKCSDCALLGEVDKVVQANTHDWSLATRAAVIHQKHGNLEEANHYIKIVENLIPSSPYAVVLRRVQSELESQQTK